MFVGVVTMFQNTIELIDREKCAFIDYYKYIVMMCKVKIERFFPYITVENEAKDKHERYKIQS